MHIYPRQIDPPPQSSIAALNTATPNLTDLLADLWITMTPNKFHIYI